MASEKLRICNLEKSATSWELQVADSFNDNLRKSVTQGIDAAKEGREARVNGYMPQMYIDAYMDGYDTVKEARGSGATVSVTTDYSRRQVTW